MDVSVHNNCINSIDFLRALEMSKTSKAEAKEKEEILPINFSKLTQEEVVKNMQAVVDSCQPALVKVWQIAKRTIL